MTKEDFLALKPGDVVELPGDQTRTIEHPADPHAMPWNQVATVTHAWLDGLSGRMSFYVDRRDVIAKGK